MSSSYFDLLNSYIDDALVMEHSNNNNNDNNNINAENVNSFFKFFYEYLEKVLPILIWRFLKRAYQKSYYVL